MISTSVDSWVETPLTDGADYSSGLTSRDAWASAQKTMLISLEEAGIETFVVRPTPKFPSWSSLQQGPFHFAPAAASLGLLDVPVATTPRPQAEKRRQLANEAIEMAVTGSGAESIDFFDTLCAKDPCQTRQGDIWLFRDVAHVSIDGALLLTDDFRNIADPDR